MWILEDDVPAFVGAYGPSMLEPDLTDRARKPSLVNIAKRKGQEPSTKASHIEGAATFNLASYLPVRSTSFGESK